MVVDYGETHKLCGWHERQVLSSRICGCFNCLATFPPTEITEWISEPESCPRGKGKTALCPRCAIDTVLPDTINCKISNALLTAMQQRYCSE